MDAVTTTAAAIAVGGLLLRDQARRFFIAHGRLLECLKFDTAVVALNGAAILGAATIDRFSLGWAFTAAGLACAIPCGRWLPELGTLHARVSPALTHWLLNWSVGRWMVLSAIMWSGSSYIYPWTIAAVHGTAEMGLWAAALGLSSLCNVPLGGLQNHYAVRIAQSDIPELARRVTAAAIRLAGLAAVFALVFAMAGDRIMALLYGRSFVAGAPVTVILTLNLLVGSASFCVSRGLFALNRGGADCMANAIPLAGFAVWGAWATYQFGPVGAAISLLVSNALSVGVRVALLRGALMRVRTAPVIL
jgi:O-antigen/teichoic acid export membrane protein